MSRRTTNYGYNISEGTDIVNPLVDIFPNWEALDGDLKDVSNDAVGGATELTTGTVHALTRSDTDRNVFVFTATSNFTAGDTFTLDGTQVSALTPAGEQLATGCYIIGSDVLVAVHGTLMTMYVSPTKVADSDKLDGHDSTYFATASDLSNLSDDLDAVSTKVGTGVLTTTAQDCVGAINELNGDLSKKQDLLDKGQVSGVNIDKVGIGCYFMYSGAVSGAQPVNGNYILISLSAGTAFQIAIPYNVAGHTMMVRMYVNNAWTAWTDV